MLSSFIWLIFFFLNVDLIWGVNHVDEVIRDMVKIGHIYGAIFINFMLQQSLSLGQSHSEMMMSIINNTLMACKHINDTKRCNKLELL